MPGHVIVIRYEVRAAGRGRNAFLKASSGVSVGVPQIIAAMPLPDGGQGKQAECGLDRARRRRGRPKPPASSGQLPSSLTSQEFFLGRAAV
jgi:hypothetical protein